MGLRSHGIIVVSALWVGACGFEKGDKVVLPDMALEEVRVSGAWAEIWNVESSHPYENDVSRTYLVETHLEVDQLRIDFERFELESGYDFLLVEDEQGDVRRFTGVRTGDQLVVEGRSARLIFQSDRTNPEWGFLVRVFAPTSCICPTVYEPVCGQDAHTFDNECQASCASMPIAYQGACFDGAWRDEVYGIESSHPMGHGQGLRWTIRERGAASIRVHFAEIDLEPGYDFVRLLDERGRVFATYTGRHLDKVSPAVPGDAVVVHARTDESGASWGFSIEGYDAVKGCQSGADCPGQLCVQFPCIRAPCFKTCGIDLSYQDVPLEEVLREPGPFIGSRIRVVAEPIVSTPTCSKMSCSAESLCCNECQTSFVIGEMIALADAKGYEYGCFGNECDWSNTCKPFSTMNAGPYAFEGRLMQAMDKSLRFDIDRYMAQDCQRAGCSSELCANSPHRYTTCAYRAAYDCLPLS